MQKKLSVFLVCLVLMGLVGIASAGYYDGNPSPSKYMPYYAQKIGQFVGSPYRYISVAPNMGIGLGTMPNPGMTYLRGIQVSIPRSRFIKYW